MYIISFNILNILITRRIRITLR